MLKRAWSSIEFKAVDEDKRIIEGIASTPATDRYEDVVEPEGAQYKLPLPFLWQHQHGTPIGWVEEVKTSKTGIRCRIRIAAEGVTAEIDKAWALIKAGLVRGLSIGFTPIESAHINGTYGYHFTKWDWLELSAVTVPANAEATITSIKSLDQEHLRAVSGTSAGSKVVRLKSSPGVPGHLQRPKDTIMKKSLQQQLTEFEAKSASHLARMDEIITEAGEAGSTLTDEQKAEHDQLDAEVKEIGEHIKRLNAAIERSKASATTVVVDKSDDTPARQAFQPITVKSNLPPGVGFARFAQAMYRAGGNHQEAIAIIKATPQWKDIERGLVGLCMKAAVPAADSTTSGWASEIAYAQNLEAEFIEYLRPRTIIGQIDSWRRVPFNMRVGSLTSGLTGYWVGQGLPIKVSKGTTSSTSLGITKVAGLSAFDDEIMRLSSPSIDMLVRDQLTEACTAIIDTSLIDPNQGGSTNVQPASLTYGVTPITATGTNYAALSTDIQSMLDTILDVDVDPRGAVLVMPPQRALALSMMVTSLGVRQFTDISMEGGSIFGMRVVVSRYVGSISGSPNYGDMIVLIHPREVFVADDGNVTIEASREASLELLDNPTNQSTGATAATSMVSMFQTNSTAVKAVRFINWTKRRSVACQFIRNAAYV